MSWRLNEPEGKHALSQSKKDLTKFFLDDYAISEAASANAPPTDPDQLKALVDSP